MTRANITFIPNLENTRDKEKPFRYFYHNGDQYPSGIRDHYHVQQFIDSNWTVEAFDKWYKDNYNDDFSDPDSPEWVDQPKVYFTGGFITDYSYVFDYSFNEHKVYVWNWAKLIFEGTDKEFIQWLERQE